MLGFAGLEPMKSNIFAVWFVPVSGLEHFLKNMEHGINCPWHLSSSERNFHQLSNYDTGDDGLNMFEW